MSNPLLPYLPKLTALSQSIRALKSTKFNFATYHNTISVQAAKSIYGLNENEYRHLFLPGSQELNGLSGKELLETASPDEVANNIDAFVAQKKVQF